MQWAKFYVHSMSFDPRLQEHMWAQEMSSDADNEDDGLGMILLCR